MEIKDIINSNHTRVLYDNYNKVHLYKRDVVIKEYKDNWRLDKEVKLITALKKNGYQNVQEIISVSPPYIAFRYICEPTFGERIFQNNINSGQLLEVLDCLPANVSEFQEYVQSTTKTKKKINDVIDLLWKQELIKRQQFDKINFILSNYEIRETKLLHGDLRPDNIVGEKKVKCIIDWEMAGYGDFHRDLAYLYVGALMRNWKPVNELSKKIASIQNFRQNNFIVFTLYIYSACWENPKVSRDFILKGIVRELNSYQG